jgi:ATP-dependent RNA helicase RhlE
MSKTFEDFSFNKQLLTAIEEAGYITPTPIQEKGIPPILNGQDVMGIAQTGTGKTAAYVLPILMKLRYAQGDEPRALIMAPTRELAMQISEQVALFAKHTDLRHGVLYGGLGPKTQKEMLSKGLDIVIATPGRLLELYLDNSLVLKKLNTLVIDEADKMLDMGFIRTIYRVLEVIPRKRQNLLFSATMSERVKSLAGDFLEFPTEITISPQATPADTVSQRLYYVPNLKTKVNLLLHYLQHNADMNRVIIFCKTRTIADNLHGYLQRKFGPDEVRVIHANKGQNTRINSMSDFKEGNIRILVSTDVASRGLDVSMVSHVINFDVPLIYEDYVHRIGRTGRANQSGESITFCTEAEEYHIHKIEKLIRQKIPVSPIPEGVFIDETPYEEKQKMAREIDDQKRRENPDFKGAFHEKKDAKKTAKTARTTKTTAAAKGKSAKAGAKAGGKDDYMKRRGRDWARTPKKKGK